MIMKNWEALTKNLNISNQIWTINSNLFALWELKNNFVTLMKYNFNAQLNPKLKTYK